MDVEVLDLNGDGREHWSQNDDRGHDLGEGHVQMSLVYNIS